MRINLLAFASARFGPSKLEFWASGWRFGGQAGLAVDFFFDDHDCILPRDTTLNDIVNLVTAVPDYCT